MSQRLIKSRVSPTTEDWVVRFLIGILFLLEEEETDVSFNIRINDLSIVFIINSVQVYANKFNNWTGVINVYCTSCHEYCSRLAISRRLIFVKSHSHCR